MGCWPYGPDPILISAQAISLLSLAVSVGGFWLSWDLWVLGLMSTIILLCMACTTVDQTAVTSAGVFAAICAISHFIVAPLSTELRTQWRVASFAAGVGWLIAALLTFRLTYNLRPSLVDASTSTDANGLVLNATESAQSNGKYNLNEQSSSNDLHETV